MKKICVLSLVFLIFASSVTLNAVAESPASFSWYCKRNKEHLQPVIDSEMRFIEDYNGYYIDRNSADKKVIYLTFDVGYENGNVEKTMDILRNEKINGSFFILKNFLVKNNDLVKRMIAEGDVVGNHTANHKDTSGLSKEEFKSELESMETLYKEYTATELPKFFRPPEGRFSRESMRYACEMGYKTVFWSLAYADWDNNNQMSPEKAKEKILSNIHNGAIILLHPTSETNVKILPEIIRELKNQGYTFKTLNNL